MKRNATLLLATLSILVSLVSLPATGQGQQPPTRFRGDTGVVTPGVGQILRITVNGGDGNDRARVRFSWMRYMATNCNSSGPCRLVVDSQGATTPVTLDSNEAASFDIQGTGAGVRALIRVDTGNMRDVAKVRATAEIIDIATGEVTSHVIMANTEGD